MAPQPQFYLTAKDAWDAMYQDCQAAKTSIEFEQYILQNDEIGNRFLQLFIDKAREGVQIRLTLDRVGSRSIYDSPLLHELRQTSARVTFYNAINWLHLFKPKRWFPRNHTKTLLIDCMIGYMGSVCLDETMTTWRDTHMRFQASDVRGFIEEFSEFNNCPLDHSPGKEMRYAFSEPHFRANPIFKELLTQIRHAKKTIHIVTPYFLPPVRLLRALKKAARRGVDVNIMIGEKTDVPIADRVCHSYFPKLLRNRIQVFLYQKSLLHAKYTVIDNHWATLGSTNIDYLSLLRNREANLIVTNSDIIRELKNHFQNDVAYCLEATKEYWNSLPLTEKIFGYCGRLIKKVL